MKKYIVTIAVALLVSGYARAQVQSVDQRDAAMKKALALATATIEKINNLVDSLSIKVSLPNSSVTLKDKDKWPKTTDLKDRIDKECSNFQNINLRENLPPLKRPDFDIQDLHFSVQHDLMNDVMLPFLKYNDKELYDAQIDYAEARIERFLTAIGNFKLYLLSLAQKPAESAPKAPDWEVIINNALKNYNSGYKTDTVQIAKLTDLVKKETDAINKKTPVVDLTTYNKGYAIISAYSESTFGAGFMLAVGKPGKAKEMNYIGAEVIIPIRSTLYPNPGGFVLYGLKEGKILLQAGLGYLKVNQAKENILIDNTLPSNINLDVPLGSSTGVVTDSQKKENISWKAAIIYTPNKFGIGFSYSPLTKAGIQLGYRW